MQLMKTIKPQPNQTIYDLAIEQYGSCEALAELLTLNPDLRNDTGALSTLGINTLENTQFYPEVALSPECEVRIDTHSRQIDPSVTKKLETEITTFDL